MKYVIKLLEKEIYLIDYRIDNNLLTQGKIVGLTSRKQWLIEAIKVLEQTLKE